MDILKATEEISERYKNYILSSFSLNGSHMNERLKAKIEGDHNLIKGPFVELKKNFTHSFSPNKLVEDGVLSKEFNKLNFNMERPLYEHQGKAIRKVIDNKNIIVSTGTGSGKTESFLIPILDSLLKEKEHGTLGPGVRAMILYPMNALARDQLDRLSEILEKYPDITFGSYTGEVEHKYEMALESYKAMYGKEPIPNELICRDQIKETPPNILITNYSMLEYLLLRPKDSVLFNENTWKYLVIDEAHMYNGAKAIEIGMLLRRLKNKINGKDRLRCILTSASLGRGPEDNEAICTFASKLCDEKFYPEDIITGSSQDINFTPMQKGSVDNYAAIYDKLIHRLKNDEALQNKLYNNMKNDIKIKELYQLIGENYTIVELKNKIFGSEASNENFSKFLELLKYSKDSSGRSILPMKYHLFIKSLEGAFAKFSPEFDIFFQRKEEDNEFKVFEIGVCKSCNDLYIIGNLKEDGDISYLEHLPHQFSEDYKKANVSYFLVKSKEDIEIEDFSTSNEYALCTKCGRIKKSDERYKLCECSDNYYMKVLKNEISTNKEKKKKDVVHKCISCGNANAANGIINRFLLSQDVATSIITEGIYNHIESKDIEVTTSSDSIWGSLEPIVNKNQKQLLVFSDNRQQAAFFASFFDTTHGKFLRRKLLMKTLKELSEGETDKNIQIIDVIDSLKKNFRKYLSKGNRYTEKMAKRDAYKAILYEFINSDGKNSLESLGLISFSMIPSNAKIDNALKAFNITEKEFYTLLNIYCSTLRKRGVIHDYFKLDNEQKGDFEYLKRLNYVVSSKELKGDNHYLVVWNGKKSNRFDYSMKLFKDSHMVEKLLNEIFPALTNQVKVLGLNTLYGSNNQYQLDIREFNMKLNSRLDNIYQCNKCHRITSYNIRNLCPSYRCDGHLEPLNQEKDVRGSYYRNLYENEEIEVIKISEHTAQLEKEKAREIQKAFIDRNINILSCSTTFEVGIDVGDLESVLMRNMPPTPANYAQRAGRAGRRSSSDAFCVTYAALKSHDFTHFKDPKKMISGQIAPPVFDINNKKIASRHMSAYILSKFWKIFPEYFYNDKSRDVANLFFGKGSAAIEKLEDYIKTNLDGLISELKKVFPVELHELINSLQWRDELLNRCDIAKKEYIEELEGLEMTLEKTLEKIREDSKWDEGKRVEKTINTLKKMSLIQFASRYNLIPKYGFPVDTVSLGISDDDVVLNRDLQVAIREYAPGAQVVANKRLYTSRYIKKIKGREERKYDFKRCECTQIIQKNHLIDSDIKGLDICTSCGKDLSSSPVSQYTIPEFGYIAELESVPAKVKPQNSYFTEKYYIGSDKESKILDKGINGSTFTLKSSKDAKMGVLGKGSGQGFYICEVCGFGVEATGFANTKSKSHKNNFGQECNHILTKTFLGYNFETDATLIHTSEFDIMTEEEKFSFLYALLNGISSALEIDRTDIDGCFYFENHKNYLIIFDKVPGGAGHSMRLLQRSNLEDSLKEAFKQVSSCSCGIETSCYSCLRDYSNQNYHTKLSRRDALRFLEKLFKN